MAISPFDKPAGLPPVDFDFLLKAKAYNDEQQEKANKAFDDLYGDLAKVKALPQDVPLRNQKLKVYNDALNSWANRYMDNPRAGLGELRKIKSQFNQDFNYGQLGAMQSSYDARMSHEKQVNEAYSKGDINQQRRDALLNYDLFNYQGVGQENPEGRYNTYRGSTPAKEVDLPKLVDERLSGWKADKIARGGYKSYGSDAKGIYFINNKGSKEYADPKEMETVLRPLIEQNPEVRSFLDQEVKFQTMGVNPSQTYEMPDASGKPVQITGQDIINQYKQSYINNAVNYGIAKHGYFQQESGQSDLSFAPESWKEEKPPLPPSSYTIPSIISGARTYWKAKEENLSGSGRMSGALQGMTGAAEAAPSGLETMFAPWGFLTGYLAGGKKGGLSESEKSDLKAAEKIYGRSIDKEDFEAQKNLLSDYYKFMADKTTNIKAQLPSRVNPSTGFLEIDPEKSNKEAMAKNQFAFADPEKPKGANIGTNILWKEIGGSNKAIAGEDLRKKYADYTFTWSGTSTPDVPGLFPKAEIYTVIDPKTGEVAGKFAYESTDSPMFEKLHTFYQAKYFGDQQITSGGKTYTVSYERETAPYLDNSGKPLETGIGTAYFKDDKGNVVAQSDPFDQSNPDTYDAIDNLYRKVR